MSPKRAKVAKGTRIQSGSVRPRIAANITGPDGGEHRVTFSFQYADREHAGSWQWPCGNEAKEMLDFLCNISCSTWMEIRTQGAGGKERRRPKHHAQSFDSVCAEAQDRIAALRLDEVFEELFRFRIGFGKRLWGFVAGGVFYVLWWDTKHQVFPLEKD